MRWRRAVSDRGNSLCVLGEQKEPRERRADGPIQYEISNIHVGSAKGSKRFYSLSRAGHII